MSESLGFRYEDITDVQKVRFESRVRKTADDSDCWIWTGGVHNPSGYGQMGIGLTSEATKRSVGAHRISWMLANRQDLPPKLQILHSCDVKLCVNPRHLRLGTQLDNARDAVERYLQPAAENHGRSQMTWELVRLARKLNKGLTVEELSSVFGMSPTAMKRICNFETWTSYWEPQDMIRNELEVQGWKSE